MASTSFEQKFVVRNAETAEKLLEKAENFESQVNETKAGYTAPNEVELSNREQRALEAFKKITTQFP